MGTNLEDLNTLGPLDEFHRHDPPSNNSAVSADGKVAVHFRDLESAVCRYIEAAPVVLGCVAWLTSFPVLNALASRSSAIVVQKEDFLRPDVRSGNNWKRELRAKYEAIQDGAAMDRSSLDGVGRGLSYAGDPCFQGVRCVGNHNRDRRPAAPRMHNKFLVFCHYTDDWMVQPDAVWTGSFNLTMNATRSLENALYLTDETIVRAYFDEFQQILALSEPLNWSSDWCAPEWRIGT